MKFLTLIIFTFAFIPTTLHAGISGSGKVGDPNGGGTNPGSKTSTTATGGNPVSGTGSGGGGGTMPGTPKTIAAAIAQDAIDDSVKSCAMDPGINSETAELNKANTTQQYARDLGLTYNGPSFETISKVVNEHYNTDIDSLDHVTESTDMDFSFRNNLDHYSFSKATDNTREKAMGKDINK